MRSRESYDTSKYRKMTVEERILSRINKTKSCWLWTGPLEGWGYGQCSINNKMTRVHRWVWEFHKGKVPVGLSVLHRCDIRHCCNPAHLFLGTHDENMKDAKLKGRKRSDPTNINPRRVRKVTHDIK